MGDPKAFLPEKNAPASLFPARTSLRFRWSGLRELALDPEFISPDHGVRHQETAQVPGWGGSMHTGSLLAFPLPISMKRG